MKQKLAVSGTMMPRVSNKIIDIQKRSVDPYNVTDSDMLQERSGNAIRFKVGACSGDWI